MNEVFRIRVYYRNGATLGLLFFVALAAATVYGALTEVPRNWPGVFACLGLFGFFSCLSMWVLLSYFRESVAIRNGHVGQQGVFLQKQVELNEVTELHWKTVPSAGSVNLCAKSLNLKIEFGLFEPSQRLALIRYFRNNLNSGLQFGWPSFCHKIALPLARRGTLEAPEEGTIFITRQRWDWYFVPVIVVSAAIGCGLAWHLNQPRLLASPFMPTMLWLLLRLSTPKTGMPVRRISGTPGAAGFLLFLLGWTTVGVVGIAVVNLFRAGIPNPVVVALGMGWFSVVLWGARRADRIREKHDHVATDHSLAMWEESTRVIEAN